MTSDRPPSDGSPADECRPIGNEEQYTDPDTPSESADSLRSAPDIQRTKATRASNTLINALIGAAITVITALFVPLSPVLGGAIAGYLQGRDADSGLKVGALSGAIALVPLLVIVPFALLIFVFEPIAAVSILFILAIVVGFLAVYTVGFGALGGVLGVYLYDEFGTHSD